MMKKSHVNPCPHIGTWCGLKDNCTEMHFACFLSGGFITAIVVNPPEKKLAKRTSVQWPNLCLGLNVQPKIQILNGLCYISTLRPKCINQ